MLLFFVSKNFHIILKSDRSTLQNSFYSELSCYDNLASYFYEIDKGHSSQNYSAFTLIFDQGTLFLPPETSGNLTVF